MARYGMLINTKKCVGCYACRVACQMVNGLESDEAFIKFDEMEQGVYPNVYAEVVPVQCMHCEDAPCEAVSHPCHLYDRLGRGAGRRGTVHRLQVLHGRLPLRRPHPD